MPAPGSAVLERSAIADLSQPVSAELPDDLVAVLRELLTNVGKHAEAETVEVAIAIADDHVDLTVEDDGIGTKDPARRSGLANLAERAVLRGGGCEVMMRPGGGTRVHWSASTDHMGG